MNHDDAGNDNDNYRKITCPEGPDTITLHVQKGQIPSHYMSRRARYHHITCPEGPDTITFNGNVQQNYVITCPEGPDTITLHVQKGQIPSHSTATCSRITSEISTSVLPLRTLQQRVRTVLASEVRGDTSNLISVFFPMRASHLRPVSAAHCVNINHQPTSRVRFELVCNCL